MFTNSFPRGFLTISRGWRHTMGFLRRNQMTTSISHFPAASAWFSRHHGLLEDVHWFDKLGKGLWQSGGSPKDHMFPTVGEATKSSILWSSPGAQSQLTLCDPMDCSPAGSSVHGIFQARQLAWVGISYSYIWIPTFGSWDKDSDPCSWEFSKETLYLMRRTTALGTDLGLTGPVGVPITACQQ